MTVVEKVMLFQSVDLLAHVPTESLALIASLTEEVEHDAGSAIYSEGDPADSMYVVLDGEVRVHRSGVTVTHVREHEAFGTWALFDDEPRVLGASAIGDVRLLRLHRDDFMELLADNVEVTGAILKSIVRRLRLVAERVGLATGG